MTDNKKSLFLILFIVLIGVLSIFDQAKRSRKIDAELIKLELNCKELEKLVKGLK